MQTEAFTNINLCVFIFASAFLNEAAYREDTGFRRTIGSISLAY